MGRIALLPFISAAILVQLWMGASKSSSAQSPPLPASDAHSLAPNILMNQRAITVIGQGLATAPADTAKMEFRLISREPLNSRTALTEAVLKPVVDALIAIEVPSDRMTIQTNPPESFKLLVNIDKPTRTRIQEVVQVVSSALQQSDNLLMQGMSAEYAVNDCQPLERTARRAALRDAQSQIRSTASDLNIKVGEILYMTVYPLVGTPTSATCGSKIGVPLSPLLTLSDSTPPYDPSIPPVVEVRSHVSITYAIK